MVTNRELFVNIFHYKEFDRVPVFHWCGWTETTERWHKEGMPKWATGGIEENKYFNVPPIHIGARFDNCLFPLFEEKTIEETERYRIFRQKDGVIAQHWKGKSCIPHFIDFTLKGMEGWDEYKKRLQPDERRLPSEEELLKRIEEIRLWDTPVSISTGSMIGWVRDWMGVENLSYLCYDNPDLLVEMVNTIGDLQCWCLEKMLPRIQKHIKVDIGFGWEDICFRTGPLISPEFFKLAAVPNYKKIRRVLEKHGIDLYAVDCDGLLDALIPLWLDSGVNVIFPIEIGAWNADPAMYRKEYGKQLLIYGGLDKNQLAKGREAIDDEIAKRIPLMKEGGFVPLPDHLIPPDVPLEDYKYYLKQMAAIRF